MLDSDELFRVGATDFTWGDIPLSFESNLVQPNLDSAFTFLPTADFEKLVPHLASMSGVTCGSGLCYYSSDCMSINTERSFGFRAFSGNNSIPVELSMNANLISGEVAGQDSKSCYLPFAPYSGEAVMVGNKLMKEYLTVYDLENH